jgi:hypothetical protein
MYIRIPVGQSICQVIRYWLNTEFGLVNLNERDKFGRLDEYDRMDHIRKLILLKWVVGISFTDLLLGFYVDFNETCNSINTMCQYNLVKKYRVTCSYLICYLHRKPLFHKHIKTHELEAGVDTIWN